VLGDASHARPASRQAHQAVASFAVHELTVIDLSVVVPAYNEADGIAAFHRRLTAVLSTLPLEAEIIFVNDGSRDATLTVLRGLAQADTRVTVIDLARNFGKEVALTAGLEHTSGRAVVVIDADLQDPPELIGAMVQAWQHGADVVLMKRQGRAGETWLKRVTARAFYRLMQRIGDVRIPEDVGDFRLMSRRALDALLSLKERTRFMKGLFAWVGYRETVIEYQRERRAAGRSSWSYWLLWNFALDGITSFSTAPLRLASYVGLLTAMVAFGYAAWIFGKTMLFGENVRGYPTIMLVMLGLGGVQLMAIGIIGEYLGRMYLEVKQRPLYLVNEIITLRHT
jgi:polyisoprenyl-phosphate glycosyltransferase